MVIRYIRFTSLRYSNMNARAVCNHMKYNEFNVFTFNSACMYVYNKCIFLNTLNVPTTYVI